MSVCAWTVPPVNKCFHFHQVHFWLFVHSSPKIWNKNKCNKSAKLFISKVAWEVNVHFFFIKSEQKSSAPALQLLWCASFCVPAAKIHPALVVPIRHALGVHQLCEQTIPTVHEPQTKGFSMQMWALSWTSAYSHIALISWSETRWQSQSFPTQVCSIPEIACIICLVIISRSSIERCARRSTRAEWVRGAWLCLPAESFAISCLARSCLRTFVSSVSPVSVGEAAPDTSRATSSANTTKTFPDILSAQ